MKKLKKQKSRNEKRLQPNKQKSVDFRKSKNMTLNKTFKLSSMKGLNQIKYANIYTEDPSKSIIIDKNILKRV